MFIRNSKIIFLFIVITFSLLISGVKNTIKIRNNNFAIKINNINYSFTYYKNILEKSRQELEKIKNRKLSYIELISLEKNIISRIINNELILKEAKSLCEVKGDKLLQREFLKMRIFFKNREFNKRHFYKMIRIYNINEMEFIMQIKNKLLRVLFINKLLLNNLLVPGLNEIIIKYDLQIKEIELIKIPCCILQIYNHNRILDIKKVYLQNLYKFKVSEKKKVEYIILSTNDIKKSIVHKLKKKIYLHLKKNDYFLLENKMDVFSNYNMIKLNHCSKKKIKHVKTRKNSIKVDELIFLTQNLNIKLFFEKKKIIETPLGLKIIKRKGKYLVKKYKKERVFKDEYIKKLFINNFMNEISIIKNDINKKEKIFFIAKKYNIKLQETDLINNLNNKNGIFKSKIFQKIMLNNVLDIQNKILPIAFDKFCIMKVKSIICNKKREINSIENIVKEIWKRKTLTLKIFFSEKKMKIKKSKIKEVKFKKRRIKILDKKELGVKIYEKVNTIKKFDINFLIIDNKGKFLLMIKIKKIVSPKKEQINKYKRIYQIQVKKVEQQIIIFDILKNAQKKNKIRINPLIRSYVFK